MIIIIAGIGLSTMTMILLPIMVAIFVLLECVEKRSVREMWIMVPAIMPVAVTALMYFSLF